MPNDEYFRALQLHKPFRAANPHYQRDYEIDKEVRHRTSTSQAKLSFEEWKKLKQDQASLRNHLMQLHVTQASEPSKSVSRRPRSAISLPRRKPQASLPSKEEELRLKEERRKEIDEEYRHWLEQDLKRMQEKRRQQRREEAAEAQRLREAQELKQMRQEEADQRYQVWLLTHPKVPVKENKKRPSRRRRDVPSLLAYSPNKPAILNFKQESPVDQFAESDVNSEEYSSDQEFESDSEDF